MPCSAHDGHVACFSDGAKSILRSDQTQRLEGVLLYGATSCYTCEKFGKDAIAHGAKGVLGYRDTYMYVELDAECDPFSEAVISVAETSAVSSLENAKAALIKKYDEWLNSDQLQQLSNSWLVTALLRHNVNCLDALSGI